MVRNAETLRKVQTENGLTGSFKERPIAEWLAKQNPSQLEYHRAVANFTGIHPVWFHCLLICMVRMVVILDLNVEWFACF